MLDNELMLIVFAQLEPAYRVVARNVCKIWRDLIPLNKVQEALDYTFARDGYAQLVKWIGPRTIAGSIAIGEKVGPTMLAVHNYLNGSRVRMPWLAVDWSTIVLIRAWQIGDWDMVL